MKGLIFNLLESLARDAGCSEEAWELVADFAAADLISDSVEATTERLWGSDVRQSGAFEVPTEAMLTCLTRGAQNNWDLDLMGAAEQADLLELDCLADALPAFYDAIPKSGGFGPSAFCPCVGRSEFGDLSAGSELDPYDDDAEWEEELELRALRGERREH